MQRRAAVSVALVLAVGAPLAWAFGNTGGEAPAPVSVAPPAPEITVLQGEALRLAETGRAGR